jgi:cytochrome c
MHFFRLRHTPSQSRFLFVFELVLPVALCLGLCAGCGGAGATGPGAQAPQAQLELGEGVFKRHCAQCHGKDGRSGRAPRVMGEGALPERPPSGAKMRSVQFKTAADLLDWTKQKMPPGAAASLSDAEHAAVVAFMLTESGKNLGGRALDASSAPSISLSGR